MRIAYVLMSAAFLAIAAMGGRALAGHFRPGATETG